MTQTTETFQIRGGPAVELTIRPDTNDHNVAYSILTEDEYRLPRGLSGVAIDVGAHIGAATVGLLALNPDLHVVAIEPLPENLALIRENTAPYAERLTILAAAAGTKGTVHYNWGGSEAADVHRFIGNQHFGAETSYDSVVAPTVSLTQLVKQYGPIAFLKIDCEGCEVSFLDDPAIDQVAHIAGEWHDGEGGVELRFTDPGERPANRKKRGVA